jgi:hypothetical protein
VDAAGLGLGVCDVDAGVPLRDFAGELVAGVDVPDGDDGAALVGGGVGVGTGVFGGADDVVGRGVGVCPTASCGVGRTMK